MLVIVVLCFCSYTELARADPCKTYAELPRAEYRGGQCATIYGKEVCDSGLNDGWYRAVGLHDIDLEIQTTPAKINSCGTKFPFWMNGTHPTVADKAINRTVCMAETTSCDAMVNIEVKNCSGYYVYHLRKLAGCSKGYCFGAANQCPPMDPCDVFEYTTVDYNPARSSECESQSSACENFNKTQWYTFGRNLSLSATCPAKINACGSQRSLWINDTKLLSNGSEEHTICEKNNSSCCISTFKMLSKQCKHFRVYDLGNGLSPKCGRFCTDDSKAVCPSGPITTTQKTSTIPFNNRNSTDSDRSNGTSSKTNVFILFISMTVFFVSYTK